MALKLYKIKCESSKKSFQYTKVDAFTSSNFNHQPQTWFYGKKSQLDLMASVRVTIIWQIIKLFPPFQRCLQINQKEKKTQNNNQAQWSLPLGCIHIPSWKYDEHFPDHANRTLIFFAGYHSLYYIFSWNEVDRQNICTCELSKIKNSSPFLQKRE